MVNNKCIYCKKQNNLTREHAFPKALLQKNIPGWVIDKHLCAKCNSVLGKLDAVLAKKSPIAFTWDRIEDELGNKTETAHSSIYHKKACGIYPIRLFFPDPHYENLIVLHETATVNRGTSAPCDSAVALRPQIVLTQCAHGQTGEEVIAENLEKFNTAGLNDDCFRKCEEHDEVYCIFGNTYIFPPKTANHFFRRIADFKSKFMTDFHCIRNDVMMIFPERGQDLHAAETFYNSFEDGTKKITPKEEIPNPAIVKQLIRVTADPKATQDISRSITKIAFHCFLFHYREEFSGHEPIFDDVKQFIYKGGHNRFVAEWSIPDSESLVYHSNEHLHGICYFRQGDNIGCQIEFFTGLLNKPQSYGIILAGNPFNCTQIQRHFFYIPYRVHPKSPMKQRICHVESLGLIRKPSPYEGVLWLPRYLS